MLEDTTHSLDSLQNTTAHGVDESVRLLDAARAFFSDVRVYAPFGLGRVSAPPRPPCGTHKIDRAQL